MHSLQAPVESIHESADSLGVGYVRFALSCFGWLLNLYCVEKQLVVAPCCEFAQRMPCSANLHASLFLFVLSITSIALCSTCNILSADMWTILSAEVVTCCALLHSLCGDADRPPSKARDSLCAMTMARWCSPKTRVSGYCCSYQKQFPLILAKALEQNHHCMILDLLVCIAIGFCQLAMLCNGSLKAATQLSVLCAPVAARYLLLTSYSVCRQLCLAKWLSKGWWNVR